MTFSKFSIKPKPNELQESFDHSQFGTQFSSSSSSSFVSFIERKINVNCLVSVSATKIKLIAAMHLIIHNCSIGWKLNHINLSHFTSDLTTIGVRNETDNKIKDYEENILNWLNDIFEKGMIQSYKKNKVQTHPFSNIVVNVVPQNA